MTVLKALSGKRGPKEGEELRTAAGEAGQSGLGGQGCKHRTQHLLFGDATAFLP